MLTVAKVEETRNGVPSVPDETQWRWSIVLAGGQGKRMARWIEGLNGTPRPKQFCTFTGSRTMLQHTLERAGQVAPADHTLTVICRGHRQFLVNGGSSEIPGRLIEQPADRGTAAGVLLPATYVRDRDPNATLLILPSDHFIHPDDRFRLHAAHACRLAERFGDRFVILGAIAKRAETDYGWILPERGRSSPELHELGYQVSAVARFTEKPAPGEAADLLRAGGLWNTLVVAVKVRTLWRAARRLLPGLIDRLEFLQRNLRAIRAGRMDPRREAELLRDIYLDLEPADFSRDLLQNVTSSILVQSMHDVEWNDWGRPERVQDTLRRRVNGRRRGGLGLPASSRPMAAWSGVATEPGSETAATAEAIGDMP
jgi:mannose-1-phosphate guanylyltransferase